MKLGRMKAGVLTAGALAIMLCHSARQASGEKLPNIVVVMIDDLGYNQVGYHANPENSEIQTPHIDHHATNGIIMDRGYMTPWCAPSRAAFQTGSMNSFNEDVTNDIYAFDDDIGFIGGLQKDTVSLAKALKNWTKNEQEDQVYKTHYVGKWGIGGTSWANTPMGVGYDSFLGYWGDSIDSCDAWVPIGSVPGIGGAMMRAVPGYWKQDTNAPPSPLCENFKKLKSPTIELSEEEKRIACHTTPAEKPEKIMDHELLDHTKNIIAGHDYSNPLYVMHATQVLHLPMQYPKEYDEQDDYLRQFMGKDLPTPDNKILRLKTASLVKFMDDLFGEIMKSIKDAGQWDNTIVLFTSDNGGAIYTNSANNNYPLRGSKLSSFEGGLRVAQFLSGGWIDQNTRKRKTNHSDTYVVVNDWAPTLLEMAGGNKKWLLDTLEGEPYGNEMWQYIQNSVYETSDVKESERNNLPSSGSHQLERRVTFSTKLYLDIREEGTRKYIHTGENPVYFARKWNSTWPTNNDIIPDFGYASIHPCRLEDGKPLDCCYFNIDEDEHEDNPLQITNARCAEHKEFANKTYYKDLCDRIPSLCHTPKKNPNERHQEAYNLWTLYDASGPYTDASGHPINASVLGESPKCACSVLDVSVRNSGKAPNCFIPGATSPSICYHKLLKNEGFKVDCNGTYSRQPFTGDYIQSYVEQGMSKALLKEWFEADQKSQIMRLEDLTVAVRLFAEYVNRQGFKEWPDYAKFPFIAADQNSCPAKNVTAIPLPSLALNFWYITQGDVTVPKKGKDLTGSSLCHPYGGQFLDRQFFSPSIQNPLQKLVKKFNYAEEDPYFELVDGTILKPLSKTQCNHGAKYECTAYIGGTDSYYGMALAEKFHEPDSDSLLSEL